MEYLEKKDFVFLKFQVHFKLMIDGIFLPIITAFLHIQLHLNTVLGVEVLSCHNPDSDQILHF